MSNGFFYEIHDDGRAPSWAFHFHGHLSSRPAVDLLHVDGRAQSWALHDHGHLISRPAADLLHDDGKAPSWALHGHGHLIVDQLSTSSISGLHLGPPLNMGI